MIDTSEGKAKDIVARGWMLTLPESEYSKEDVEEKLSQYTYVGQLEQGEGENSYRHWQVYVENPSQVRFSTLKSKFPKGHFEKRQGSKAACLAYVTKEETALGVTVSNGALSIEDKKPGPAQELERLRMLILTGEKTYSELMIEEASAAKHYRALQVIEHEYRRRLHKGRLRDVKVTYIFGATGVGKTRHVYDRYAQEPDELYVVSDYAHPFDAYDNEKCLVLDEFAGQLNFSYLLQLLDRYPVELRARYRNSFANFDEVFILSNLSLEEVYEDIRREGSQRWNALLRRIDSYYEMKEGGELVELEKPVRPARGSARPRRSPYRSSDLL